MPDPPFRLAPLGPEHDRTSFCCGEEALDRYLKTQATQDIRRHLANCFVAVETVSGVVAAYYTLSAASVRLADLPPDEIKRLPRYPTVPAVRVGRLAVDRRFQQRGLGSGLLIDALRRTLGAAPAAYAIVVEAKNDKAAAFYSHHGFLPIIDQPRTLFLPIRSAGDLLPG